MKRKKKVQVAADMKSIVRNCNFLSPPERHVEAPEHLLTYCTFYLRISEQRQELESEALERGIYSASSSDEEADFLPHCRQGYEESSASESDLPEIPGGEVSYGNACDFD